MSITVEERAQINTEEKIKKRKRISYITWLIVLFIPTYAVTDTYSSYGLIRETVFFFPWMIFIHFQPSSIFSTDEYVVISIPWSYLLFIPFLYVLRLSWDLYTSESKKINNSVYIIFASFIQYLLILMTLNSQTPIEQFGPEENVTVYFIPQILIILIHSISAYFWYVDEMKPKS